MFEKKRGTRFLASVMALVMLLSLAPVGALAVEDEEQNQEVVALPANQANPKPVGTDGENTTNTNEEPTPPPRNEGDAGTPADNNDASTAVSEMPVIMNPVDLLNQVSDYAERKRPQSDIQDATFFYLKTPTSNPNSNKAKDWGSSLGNGTINTKGLIWVDSSVWNGVTYVENATNVTNSNVQSWPSTHGEYNLGKDGYVLDENSTHWQTIFNAYKNSIKEKLSMEDLQESDVEAIILTPFKVSRYNITDKSYHVDCEVEVKCHTFATATFKLWDETDNEYKFHSAENYQVDSSVTFPRVPDKPGYTFSGWYLDEELTQPAPDSYTINNNVNFYAKYEKEQPPTPKTYTLTIKYVYEDGSTASSDYVKEYKAGERYDVSSPEIAGYTADKAKVSGTIANDVTETVTYKANTYTLTIKYVYEDGSTASNDYVKKYKTGERYDVSSPEIAGYTANKEKVSGTIASDVTETVTYYLDNWKDADETKDPEDKDSETGGDGIPDCDQVLIKYVSSNSDRGTVSPDMEVLTIRKANERVVPTANGSTATDKGGRNYFSNWTDTTGKQVSTNATLNNETIQKVIKEFTGGETYTFTANFERSSGGGSDGSNRPKPPVVEIPDDVPTGLNGKDHYAYIIGYGNNDVRPQNNITRAEVATIFFRLLTDETREANMTKSNGYNDVKDGDWFCCAVSTLSKMGIIKGYEDGSFKPNDPISRAEFAAIAARFDPDGDKTPASFFDVTSHWAKDEISIAANHGWIKGYEDGSFKPDQKITRAETMTLVNRVLNRLPEAKDDLHKDMKTWVDNMDETAWYYLDVQEATNSHYFKNKTGTKFEQWTDLRDTRDWSELEK